MPTMDPLGRSEAFQAGQSLGKFYLVRLIGEGGTSRIFKALQQPINRIVALKIPSFAAAGSILSPDEFLSEATLMARLDHPNVVRIHDFGVHEDKAFICMEYVEGRNLAEWIGTDGPMSHAGVLATGLQTLDGLSHAHAHDVLHLDLSPANVLIGRQGAAKLSDFGMAGKKLRSEEGRIVGTPAFLSPEHVAGAPGTRRSDLFAFGSLLYFAATGEPLFDPGQGNTRVTQAIREIESARVRPPEDRLRRLPAPLAGIVRMSLQGSEGPEILAALRAAYRAACGDVPPDETLRRELGAEGSAQDASPNEPIPEGQALRELYLGLREAGRHREAVALLERAMRRQPENPMLRELLAQPPASRKSGAATVEVGAGPSREGGRAPARSKKGVLWAAAGSLAVTLALLAWVRAGRPAPDPRGPLPKEQAAPVPPPASGAASDAPAAAEGGPRAAAAPEMILAAAREVRNLPSSRKEAKPATARRPRPPAVALSGPAGTRVSVDDTAEWIAPGPKGGWSVTPGLVNITLTPPGQGRPISSSLYVSDDTLYVLSLDDEGGFSVSRRRR